MRNLTLFASIIIVVSSSSLVAQKKANIAFVLRGYDKTCYFCDPYSFDVHAKLITEGISRLSFGRITTYEIIEHGIDDRSPVQLQSVKDIETLQASLDGWPESKWNWLRNRTDFWLVVPAEFRPTIEASITWMKANKLDFATWGRDTDLGKIHYRIVQTNVF